VVDLVERLSVRPFPVGLRAWDGSRAGAVDGPCLVLRSPRPAAEARLTGLLHTRRRDRAAIAHH
jgi:cyclopropane-fatty-acyl-phospholipid synthase